MIIIIVIIIVVTAFQACLNSFLFDVNYQISIVRCDAFKCGITFHCREAVKAHFAEAHLKGRLVEAWDDH